MAFKWGSFAGGLSTTLNRGMDRYLERDNEMYRRKKFDEKDARDDKFAKLIPLVMLGKITKDQFLSAAGIDDDYIAQVTGQGMRAPQPMIRAAQPMAQPALAQAPDLGGGLGNAETFAYGSQPGIGLMGF